MTECALSTERLEFHLTSTPAQIAPARRAVEKFAAAAGLAEGAVHDVGLCVNEALANVIRHAYAGAADKPIAVTAERTDEGVRVSIRDWGNGGNPSAAVPKPYNPLEPGGLGLICLRSMMDRATYQPQPDGMLLVLEKNRADRH